MEVVPVLLSCLEGIAGIRIFLPKDMKSQDQRNTARKNIDEVKRRFGDGISVLDPIENMGITDESFKNLLRVSFLYIGNTSDEFPWLTRDLENRGSRVKAVVQPTPQFSSFGGLIQPLQSQGRTTRQDQSDQEEDHRCTFYHAA